MKSVEEWKKCIATADTKHFLKNSEENKMYYKLLSEANHCIGMDTRKPYKRSGKWFYKPYRNYFDDESSMWDAMVELGLAYKKSFYHLTLIGLDWLSDVNGIYIYNSNVGSVPDVYREVVKFFCECDNYIGYGCWLPTSAKSCAVSLRLPIVEVKQAVDKMVEQEYLTKTSYGGYDKEEGVYCVSGYKCTALVQELDVWQEAHEKAKKEIYEMLNEKEL